DLEPEFSTDGFQQIAERHMRIENVDSFELRLIDALQIRTQDGRLPQAHLTDERDEALPVFDAIDQCPQRRLMARAQKEELWVWSDVKGRFFQIVKIEIHLDTFCVWMPGSYYSRDKIILQSWHNESQPCHTATLDH